MRRFLPLLAAMLAAEASAQRLIQLTSNGVTNYWAAVSADGSTVAYTEAVAGIQQLFAVNADGTNPRQLTTASSAGPLSLTEDGSLVCYLSGGTVWLARTDGGGLTQVTTRAGAGRPMVSADGSKIVFEQPDVNDREIWSVNPDGTGLLQLTSNTVQDVSPGISGDGTLVAFASPQAGNQNIWVIGTNGQNPAQVTFLPSGTNVFPRMDRTGLRVAFESSVDGDYEIYSVLSSGAGLLQLTRNTAHERFSSLSLDGEKILFHSDATAARELYVVNFDGTGLRRITAVGDPNVISVENYYPSLNGDGSIAAFVSRFVNGGQNPEGDDEVFLFRDALTRQNPARIGQRSSLFCDVPPDAGLPYQAAASFGTSPGIALPGGRTLFLNPDLFLLLSLTTPSIFGGFTGTLDPNGQAFPFIDVPNLPALVGFWFYAAFVTLDVAAPGGIRTVSNTIRITVQA